MKLYLGLTENSPSHLTRVFAEMDGRLVDLNLAYAVYLAQVQGEKTNTYQLAAFHFPENIAAFLQRGEPALQAPGGLTAPVQAQTTKLNVAYTSTTTNFSMEMMITHVRTPKLHNIKHPSKPWYVVSLEIPQRSRKDLGLLQRFTVAVESPAKLKEVHHALLAQRESIRHHGNRRDNRTIPTERRS